MDKRGWLHHTVDSVCQADRCHLLYGKFSGILYGEMSTADTHNHCVYAVCAKVLSANRHGRMSTNMINVSHVFRKNKAILHIGKAIIRMVYL